jgi:uncharacterized protein
VKPTPGQEGKAMLRVKTVIGKSAIHGIGLFANQPVAKGEITWEYDPEFDTAFTEEQIARMPPPARDLFEKYAYYDKLLDKHILCADDQRFINHSSIHFNIRSTPRRDIACRKIDVGEELTCNYNHYDDTYFSRLGLSERTII